MILHLTPGSTPVEVHVHGEFGETERLTVAPRSDAPASTPPTLPTPIPGRRWPLVAVPIVALLAGVIGYQTGASSRNDARRLASVRNDLRLPQPPTIPQVRDTPVQVPLRAPQLDSAPVGPAEVPPAITQLLTQPPAVSPRPEPVPRPASPAGSNPFGLE